MPWNLHEPRQGEFHFEEMLDFVRFIRLAGELGLYVIVRPGPYICAEWDNGGLPVWLTAQEGLELRRSNAKYLSAVEGYLTKILPMLAELQLDQDGPVVAFQIENEYGYFGNDSEYMNWMKNLMTELGMTVPFVTSDGPWGAAFKTGQIEGVLPTGNFGSHCEKQFGVMKAQMPANKPLMNMEFWAGWFDAWGNKIKMRSILKQNIKDYDYVIKNGHNINIYMFHGGTNFGFMNGSNYYGHLTPDTTSYDYDAPIAEDGTLTKKYFAFKKCRHFSIIIQQNYLSRPPPYTNPSQEPPCHVQT